MQEFLDQVLASAKRQVLIEATVAEVQLNNQYQRGIDWQRLRSSATTTGVPGFGTGTSGIEFGQTSAGTPAGINTNAFVLGGAITSLNFNFALKLLESFGDVRVLSSPKISVLNNQTAVLKVVRQPGVLHHPGADHRPAAGAAPRHHRSPPRRNSVPVGFIMSVVPQISETDTVVLNVRPDHLAQDRRRRRSRTRASPRAGVASLIPVIQTREIESVLRVQSGQIAVLGGLMQDSVDATSRTPIPACATSPARRSCSRSARTSTRRPSW